MMKKTTKLTLVVIFLLMGAGCYLMLNTRMGVYIALDVIGEFGEVEVQTGAEDGPLVLTASLSPVREITLPDEIEQASGIRMHGDRIYICTDQTELFELDHEWNLVREAMTLVDGLLYFKQGALEGIALEGDKLLAIGEFGAIKCWSQGTKAWERSEDRVLPAEFRKEEFSSMVVTDHGSYASFDDHPAVLDLESGQQRQLVGDIQLKPGRELNEISFSGVAAANGRLVLLSEDYTSLVIVDEKSFAVQAVLGIDACAAADIEMDGTEAYIVVDHNYREKRPPVQVYDLSKYLN